MTIKPTSVSQDQLQTSAAENGCGELGLSQTHTEMQCYQAKVLSMTDTDQGVIVELDASPLFPGGGGQPPDRGTVDELDVLEVIDHRHLRLEHPPKGETVTVEVDWSRRFDLMQQHTAQHVISSIALDEQGWTTLSFHLSMENACIVLDRKHLTDAQVQWLEQRANEVVKQGLSVRPRLATSADFNSGKIRCRKLPDVRSGALRLIDIDGIDLNTCGGTHVQNTAQLQMIRLMKCEPHRGASRVFFEAGERVLRRSRRNAEIHHEVNQLLSCAVDQYAENIRRIQKEAKAASKTIKRLSTEMAEREATSFKCREGAAFQLVVTPNKDVSQLNRMAQILTERAPNHSFVLLSKQDVVGWFVLMVGDEHWVECEGRQLMTQFGARGGGGKGRLQGRIDHDESLRVYLKQMEERS